jgi:hypothetical protein
MTPAPIVLFTYKRLDTLKKTVTALKENYLAQDSNLFIFSDAAKNQVDIEIVTEIRLFLKTITGFKSVTIFEATVNKGLATSIILGVTRIINQYGKVIVLEDDLITSKNFLLFTNKALESYKNDSRIFSIAGYTPPIKRPIDDIYFTMRSSSWGWATWKDRWNEIDWIIDDYQQFKNNKSYKRDFNKMGSDMTKMLNDQMTGKIDSWAIRWCYNQFISQQYTVHPTISKVQNVGTDVTATNTRDRFNRFATPLDDSGRTDFEFKTDVQLNDLYLRQFLKQSSLTTRIKYKILNSLSL